MNLNTRAQAAQTKLAELTGLNRTDLVNKALILYAELEEAQENGAEVMLRQDGEVKILRFL